MKSLSGIAQDDLIHSTQEQIFGSALDGNTNDHTTMSTTNTTEQMIHQNQATRANFAPAVRSQSVSAGTTIARRRKSCENISSVYPVTYRKMSSYHNISDLFRFHGFASEGDGNEATSDNINQAQQQLLHNVNLDSCTCEFAIVGQSFQMAHGMQQLYRCITWWRYCSSSLNNGSNRNMTWTLVWRKDPASGELNRYMKGIIQAYQDAFNVRIVSELPTPTTTAIPKTDTPRVTALIPHTTRSNKYPHYAMRTPEDTIYLRDTILQYYNLMDDGTSTSTSSAAAEGTPSSTLPRIKSGGCQRGKQFPVIGILNRADDRRIQNVVELQSRVREEFSYNDLGVTYFENYTFYEQVQYMNSIDILLSPHGAQLVSIPFMPSSTGAGCSGLIEFFQRGYFVSYYFGSLAAMSNITYAHLYTGYNSTAERRKANRNGQTREWARRRNICLNIDAVVDGVRGMINEWKTCCENALSH